MPEAGLVSTVLIVRNGAQFLERALDSVRAQTYRSFEIGRVMETLVARRTLFEAVGSFDPTLPIANNVDWFARVQDLGVPGTVLPQLLLLRRTP